MVRLEWNKQVREIVPIWDPLCDTDICPDPWHWPWILKVKYSISCNSGICGRIDVERTGYELIVWWTHFRTLAFDPAHDLYKVKVWKAVFFGMHGFDLFEFMDVKTAWERINIYAYFHQAGVIETSLLLSAWFITFLCSYTCMTTMDGDSMTFMEFHRFWF